MYVLSKLFSTTNWIFSYQRGEDTGLCEIVFVKKILNVVFLKLTKMN